MTVTAALLALGLALGSSDTHGAVPAGTAPQLGAPAEHAAAPAAQGGGHGGGHEASLPEVMMHHVANGYVLELPGICDGFHWNCEVDLRQLFGTQLDAAGKLSGPLVFAGGKLDMTPSKHVVMMWLAALLLLGLLLLVVVPRRSVVPRGVYNFFELLVQFVRDIAISNIGKRDADRFVPYLASAFFFILFMNLLGLVPFMATATANVSVTVGLALFTFLVTQYAAVKAQGVGGYLAHLTGGVPRSLAWLWPIMIPVEILGLFTKPFALTIRLFANMVAGHFVILALLGLIFAISVFVAPVSIALALAIFLLELFVAFVQAYIFTMLSALFIGAGLVHHGHGEGHAEHDQAHHASDVAGNAPGHG